MIYTLMKRRIYKLIFASSIVLVFFFLRMLLLHLKILKTRESITAALDSCNVPAGFTAKVLAQLK